MGGSQRTGCVLSAADLDEFLDVRDFLRHGGGMWDVRGGTEDG